jgi:polysaccharide pyruvyl transferase WcaK-like protein
MTAISNERGTRKVQVYPSRQINEWQEQIAVEGVRPPLHRVTILDTAAASTNLGDCVIMEAVRHEIAGLFPNSAVFAVTSHEWMGPHSRRLIRQADWAIAGGTSLLSSRMWFRSNWRVKPIDALSHLNVVLMGAGWYQYQGAPDPYSRWMLRSLLDRTAIHSVRDSYTLKKLASLGITNAVNTGCPTLWPLIPAHCARLPKQKAGSVLTTLNSYPKLYNQDADRRMLQTLRRHYRDVYFWIQTYTDFEYARSLDPALLFVNPNLGALDAALSSNIEIDYVGNRLHAGIRALQQGRRAIIVEIDNRAREMGRDFGLPTVARTDFDRLEHMIKGPLEISLSLPNREINIWKDQFQASRHPAP